MKKRIQPRATERSGRVTALAFIVGGIGGGLVWLSCAGFDLRREGWDDPSYFTIGLPALVVLSFLLGCCCPTRAWLFGAAPIIAQIALAVVGNPTASLLPLGLVFFAVLSLPCMYAAALAGLLRRKIRRRQSA